MDRPDFVQELAPGILMWRARHPDWHSTSELVASYALVDGDDVALVDPLVDDEGAVLAWLESFVGRGRCAIYVTIPYHVRSSVELARAFDAPVVGERRVERRLERGVRFNDATSVDELPLGLSMLTIGNPRRAEMPVHSPTHRALVVGDLAVGIDGGLRLWDELGSDTRRAWWRDRFLPSLAPLLDADVEHVLVTHGTPVIGTGSAALREMVDAPPVELRVSMLDAEARPGAALAAQR
jgi:glyoxylase-like metal-dependent hydrolase (beta-lactamase superfamily II)